MSDRPRAQRVDDLTFAAIPLGPDVGLSAEPIESFRLFQSRVLNIYDQLTAEFGFRTIEATGEIPNQQKTVRRMAQEILRDYDQRRARGNHVAALR